MKNKILSSSLNEGMPVSISIGPALEAGKNSEPHAINFKRLLFISVMAIINAIAVGLIAIGMVDLIGWVTGVSFYGKWNSIDASPAGNHLGIWVIFVPIIGGVIVGIMAKYGSKAIRGHGIPEAMEQVLTNDSKVPPIVTFLKPLSAAVSIGTGGPFGAEGPIIAGGGALGSLMGQIFKMSSYERKILLTAGAAAGMAAIFGSPVAAVLLAIELLLFEFSPRSLIPVALGAFTGAAAHSFFFGTTPVFAMHAVPVPNTIDLIVFLLMGALIGLISVGVTKVTYIIEDTFEKLPIHWMWWPAIGGIAVGIVGYFAPSTMGVGYDNIREILAGHLTINILLVFCFLKFISWTISLSSGTSGGTLAPLFTIGGALGALLAIGLNYIDPSLGLNVSVAALVGMAALFSGAARALLTAIVFAIETTGQSNVVLPLIGGCAAAYFVSYIMMRGTLMTEKISRRGIVTPDSYEPDILSIMSVKDILTDEAIVLSTENTILETRSFISKDKNIAYSAFAVIDEKLNLVGVLSMPDIFNSLHKENDLLRALITKPPVSIFEDESLQEAVHKMAISNVEILPVLSRQEQNKLVGVLSYKDVLKAREFKLRDLEEAKVVIRLRQRVRVFIKGTLRKSS